MFQKEAPEKTEKGKESRKGREVEDEEGSAPPPQCTAIAWISDKYFGTPLQVCLKWRKVRNWSWSQLTDQRLGKLADWVTRNNITVVKLDSTQKVFHHSRKNYCTWSEGWLRGRAPLLHRDLVGGDGLRLPFERPDQDLQGVHRLHRYTQVVILHRWVLILPNTQIYFKATCPMSRSNNWSIPILVGADFNMDMRNFDLSEHPGTQFSTKKVLNR